MCCYAKAKPTRILSLPTGYLAVPLVVMYYDREAELDMNEPEGDCRVDEISF